MTEQIVLPLNKLRLEQVVELHQTDKIDAAISGYQTLIKQNPSSDVYHLLGIAYAQLDQYQKAKDSLHKALDLDPNNAHYLATLGNIYRRNQDLSRAKENLLSALKYEPKLVSAQHNLGIVYYQSQDFQAATTCFKTVINLVPHHAEALYNLALCMIQSSRIQQAKSYLEHAIECAPAHPKALFQLAQIYHEEQAFRQAQVLYEQHLDNHPKHAEALQNLGVIYLQLKQDTLALKCLEQAVKIHDKLEDIHHNLASVYLHRRKYQQALTHWLKHLALHHDTNTLYNIGVTYSYLGRYEEATDYLFSVLKKNPQHYEAIVNLGAVYLQANKRELAQTYYLKAQNIKPSPAIAFVLESLQGTQTAQASPPEYVEDLFDHYAHHYDEHLQQVLHYRVPYAIHQLLKNSIHPKPNSLATLDLGCGTGLCAEPVHPYCHTLVGIDMSANMLDIAKKKKLYTSTIQGDIFAHLPTPNSYDLVLSGDLLPYLGDLSQLFNGVSASLTQDGYWLFSVEMTNKPDFYLGDNARFLHNKDYIESLALSYSMHVIAYENVQLRTQQQAFVPGYVFCLRKVSRTVLG